MWSKWNGAWSCTQPPSERPYGVEAIMRDDSGNWYSFTQAHRFTQGAV